MSSATRISRRSTLPLFGHDRSPRYDLDRTLLLGPPVTKKATRVVTVKATGGDYTSLRAAIIGEAAGAYKNLVASNIDLVIECYAGVVDSTIITEANWSGFVTDWNHRIIIRAAVGNRSTTGKWDATQWRCSFAAQNYGIAVFTVPLSLHVEMYYVQLENPTGLGMNPQGITLGNTLAPGSGGLLVIGDGCVLRHTGTVTSPDGGAAINRAFVGPHTLTLRNMVIDGWGMPLQESVYAPGKPLFTNIFNVTAVNFVIHGFTRTTSHDSGGFYDIANLICQKAAGSAGVEFEVGYSPTRARNILTSDAGNDVGLDTTHTVSGAIPNTTLTFVDKAGGDYRLSASDTAAIGAGVDLSPSNSDGVPDGFTTDALGLPR